ncbi:ArnT family glycosyltransferase [Hypericibacter sp.]|uniref:ArnT family glycosyltransferase n=1 Tax=Hypericibacter sp. TaxID=2705401 RepID=UPI003D6D11F1
MASLSAILEHPRKGSLLLAVVALLWLLPGFFSLPPIDRDESRFAQATRQMMQSGDLIDIHFQDTPRYKKPVGIYWLQAAANWITGGSPDGPSIWRFRLPSLAAALAAVLLTAWMGRLLFSPPVGFLAGLILAAAPLFGIEIRQATTDAVLLALILAAMVALLRVYLAEMRPAGSAPPGVGNALMFWLAIGAGFLIKGPVILFFVGLTALALALLEMRARWLLRLYPLPGALLALALAAPWFFAIMAKSGGAFVQQSIKHDFFDKILGAQEGHAGLPGYYAATLFLGLWPFALPVGLAMFRLARRRGEPEIRFCIAWLIPAWLILEMIPTKLPHYALPLYAGLALLTAYSISQNLSSLASTTAVWQRFLGCLNLGATIVIGVAIAGAGLWLPRFLHQPIDPMAWPYAFVIAAAMLIGSIMTARGRALPGVVCLLVASQLACLSIYGRLLPNLDVLWPSRMVAEAIRAYADCPSPRLASVGFGEPSLVFLLGTETQLTDPGQAAASLADHTRCRFALITEDARAAFDAAATKGAISTEILAQLDTFNYSKGDWQRLTLYAPGP